MNTLRLDFFLLNMWEKHETCIYKIGKPSPSNSKIAAFDFDGTLALSPKGETYASKGFVYAYQDTISKLQQYDKTHTVVIFSNRKGSPWAHKAAQNNLDRVISETGINLWVFFAIGRKKDDKYRKPASGMMSLFIHLSGISLPYSSDSFYCGDSVGPESKCPWNRWGTADKEFAMNTLLPFAEPYQIFTEFPQVPYDNNTKVIMTCGQYLSGWESMNHLVGKIVKTSEKTALYFINDELLSNSKVSPLQEGWCYYILGAHPTENERTSILDYLKIPKEQCVIAMYFRGCSDKKAISSDWLKSFTSTFKLPKIYARAN